MVITIRKQIKGDVQNQSDREGKKPPMKGKIENNSKINKPVLLRSDVFAEMNKRKMESDYRRFA